MTDAGTTERAAVRWLTSQSLVFGAMAALLGIVANAMFLDAYGSTWLPVTYIAIGIVGFAVSGGVARSAQRFDLVRIAVAVLGGAAALIAAAWLIAAGGDGAWVSAPLLVLFPILIQLGFVFIGAQGGRLLDISGIKRSFPRIMAGFPVGAVAGGVLGGWLVSVTGRTQDLLLATAIAEATFAVLVLATERRHPAQLGGNGHGATTVERHAADDVAAGISVRQLLRRRFVLLIVAYQVLSALGSQLADFLVLDRATAQYTATADLARFMAGYTAVMNLVAIAFLFALAGPLLQRFGLRLGIEANPFVVTILAVGMVVVYALTGASSLALLAIASATRIADIALTDGTTRTSINAMYQVLPGSGRLAVQTTVEGIGVPFAIGISGVLILVLNALPAALLALIVVTVLVCGIWTWAAVLLYRAYAPALLGALARRRLLDPAAGFEATDDHADTARDLLASGDIGAVRLGVELLGSMSSPGLAADLAAMSRDPDPAVRLPALAGLAAAGDEPARGRLALEVRGATGSPDAAVRRRAAGVLAQLDPAERAAASGLLVDDDASVRRAALEAVQAGDVGAVPAVVAALADSRFLEAASGAVERLGDAVVPSMDAQLAEAGSPAPSPVVRLVRSAATPTPMRDDVLRRHVGHRDRELGLVVMTRLASAAPTPVEAAGSLDATLAEDAGHAGRILAALVVLEDAAEGPRAAPAILRRALHDELTLVQHRVVANRLARHGTERLGPVMVGLAPGAPNLPLALEALEVLLAADESRVVLAIVQPGLADGQRLRGLPASSPATDRVGTLRDLVEDPDDEWRSPWLRACAILAARAEGVLGRFDLTAARARGDPIIDEVLGPPAPEIDPSRAVA